MPEVITKVKTLLQIKACFVIAFASVALSAVAQTTAPNEWTWIGGSKTGSRLDLHP
jgi:hypothetical protein